MAKRVCLEPGCPTLTDTSRCERHTRERDRARGTRQQRGYDAKHYKARSRVAPLVATGQVKCWRCGELINPAEPWDYGHDDLDRTVYRGPEHAACNRATASRR
jgi:hypothetical protein